MNTNHEDNVYYNIRITNETDFAKPAVFKENGTVHAGNSSGITDGAASMLVMSREAADRLGVAPMARCRSGRARTR